MRLATVILHFAIVISFASAFRFRSTQPPKYQRYPQNLQLTSSKEQSSSDDEAVSVIGVVAPLKYVGPYACLQLDFPHLQTDTLTFVLDTGASVSTISKDIAEKLNLPVCMKKEDLNVLGTAGAGGALDTGDIVMLGNCTLGGMPEGYQNITFMRHLTAASLDIGMVSAIGAGLLGVPFFKSIDATEFDWYGTDGDPPTVQFYYGMLPDDAKKKAICIPLQESFFGVPTIIVNINGVAMKAMIDTGSPITLLSTSAAEKIGVGNALSTQEQQDTLFLKIKGLGKDSVDLIRTTTGVSLSIGSIDLGKLNVCVGNLPGITLASDLSSTSGPEVIIGLDALRRSYRTILSLRENVVWFEPMPESLKKR